MDSEFEIALLEVYHVWLATGTTGDKVLDEWFEEHHGKEKENL